MISIDMESASKGELEVSLKFNNISSKVASREIETTVFDPASQFLSNISRRA